VRGGAARLREEPRARDSGGRRRAARRPIVIGVGALVAGLLAAGVLTVLTPIENAIKEITLPLRHDDIIRQQARQKDLDPALIAAVIYRESKFRDQTSKAGAKGLMQILPGTAQFVARKSGGTRFEESDLANPQINIAYGCWYLRYLLDRYRGNEVAAIAAYNAGHERVDRWGGEDLTLDDIEFVETRQYTQDVLEKRGEYAKRYRKELGL
jgi:soluble lytic murein transglycosylase